MRIQLKLGCHILNDWGSGTPEMMFGSSLEGETLGIA